MRSAPWWSWPIVWPVVNPYARLPITRQCISLSRDTQGVEGNWLYLC